MLLQPVVLIKVAVLVVLCSLQVVLGILDDLLDVLTEVNCIIHLTLVTQNDINRQPIMFRIYQLKWRAISAFCHC